LLIGTPWQYSTTNIADSTISRNTAHSGAGIYVYPGHYARLKHTTVRGNTAASEGGGMFNHQGDVVFEGGAIQDNSAGGWGGAIFVYDPLAIQELVRVTVRGNSAARGGGIFADGSLWVIDSTLHANRALNFGGGLAVRNGRAFLENSTLSANVTTAASAAEGGGAYVVGGMLEGTNVTFSGNASLSGGALAVDGGVVSFANVILANSTQGGNCQGAITSSKYSIASDNTCALAGLGDRNATDPKLTPLGAYGGPTLVHMLATGSPAIDGVFGNDAPSFDQRGMARPLGLGFDIGAVERTPTDTDLPIDLIFADGFDADGLAGSSL
jgi:predicted outer membrane repeat protein